MKNKILRITVVLLLSVLCLNAQEKKKVHVKIVKDIDGETTTIDTVFEGSEHEGIYFFSDEEFDKHKLDSILKMFHIKDNDGTSVISLKDRHIHTDSLKQIWVSVDSDVYIEGEKSGEHVIVKISDGAEVVDCKNHFTILDSDSIKIVKEFIIKSDGEDVFLTKEGNKKVVIKSSGKSSAYFLTMDGDKELITITEDMNLEKGKEGTVNVFVTISDDEDAKSEVIIKKIDGKSKTIELYIDEDGENSEVKIIELEEELKNAGENVKITKYKTDDGELVIKAVISEEESTKKDKK